MKLLFFRLKNDKMGIYTFYSRDLHIYWFYNYSGEKAVITNYGSFGIHILLYRADPN